MNAIVDGALAVCTLANKLVVVVTLCNRRPRPPCWGTHLPNPVMTVTVTYKPSATHAKVVVDDQPAAMYPTTHAAGFHAAALAEAYGLDLDAVHVSDEVFDSVCVFTAGGGRSDTQALVQ